MTPDTPDIATRLRQTRANMLGTDDDDHYWDCHEGAAEIDRLRQWARLTDAEREVIVWCMQWCEGLHAKNHATLRTLLDRTKVVKE